VEKGRLYVKVAALVAAAVYALTGFAYLQSALTGRDYANPIQIWWGNLWLIGACAVAAAGLGQDRADGWQRVFALSLLAFLVGAALAAEALGLAAGVDGRTVFPHQTLHQLGFFLSWPVFVLALIEDVFALGEH
jgi:hypothetical protein